MKLLIALIPALFVGSLAFAEKDIFGDISCQGNRSDEASLQLDAKLIVLNDGANIRDVIATWLTFGDRQPSVGRTQYLENDKNYKPKKYKNTYRFNLYELTDVTSFGKFYPDSCSIKVMIPFTAGEESTFKAPVQYSCEQSGGSLTMDCTFKSRN